MPTEHRASIRAEAGFTLVDLLFVLAIIGLLATMSIPGLLRARGAAQAASAIGTVRVVNSSQLSFAVTCGSGFYAPDFGTLGVAPPNSPTAFLPPELSTGSSFLKQGYTFTMSGTALAGAPPTCNGRAAGTSAPGYAILGDPVDPVANPYFFASNADGTIYRNTATFAGVMPESGPSSVGTSIR